MKLSLKSVLITALGTIAMANSVFAFAPRPHSLNPAYQPPSGQTQPVGVPEPGTLGLMGIGLVVAGLIARRRK